MNIVTIMESPTSWEFECRTTTSSEFRVTHLPPGVTSPSLYQVQDEEFAYGHDGMAVLASSLKLQPEKSIPGPRAETAAKLLRDLEGRASMDLDGYNDFGQNWNEESLNLELFHELSDVGLRYSCPPSPVSDEFENQHQLAEFSDPAVLGEDLIDLASAEFPESNNQLSADFQMILDMLPEEGIVEIKDAKICGAPFIQLEEGHIFFAGEGEHILLADDFILETDIAETEVQIEEPENGSQSTDDGDSNDMQTTEGEDDDQSFTSTEFTESELAACGMVESLHSLGRDHEILDLSFIKSDPDSDCSDDDYVPEGDESDSEVETTLSNQIILVSRNTPHGSRLYRKQDAPPSINSYNSNPIRKQQKKAPLARTQKSKTGRRNRKSSKDNDRIKLQNRTAAARYRMKKKLESAKVKEIEEGIERENSALSQQSDDLKRNIILVKQLIRDVFKSKQSMSKSSPDSRIRKRN